MNPNKVSHVTVLGAGNMGSQIAKLIASKHIPCLLLDVKSSKHNPNKIADDAIIDWRKRQKTRNNDNFLIQTGNFSDHLTLTRQSGWIIEAIIENKEAKLELLTKVSQIINARAILSTNTSSIPISEIAQNLPDNVKTRFIGTHFFNPPRILRLLELIPSEMPGHHFTEYISACASESLDRSVVVAKDVPGFIANRIGVPFFLSVLKRAKTLNMSVEEIDALTGPVLGHPRSATYKTLDLTGLDILLNISDNTYERLHNECEKRTFLVPEYVRTMVDMGLVGEKATQGFYRKQWDTNRNRFLLQTFNSNNMKYETSFTYTNHFLTDLLQIRDHPERLRRLVNSKTLEGEFAWHIISQHLAYAALRLGEITSSISDIDKAVRLGFNWQMGPFETWDALGIQPSVTRMKNDGLALPQWVRDLAMTNGQFYKRSRSCLMQVNPNLTYTPVNT